MFIIIVGHFGQICIFPLISVSITNRNPHLPPFHSLIKVGALSCNQQETEPALPTGRSGKVAGVGGSEEARHFYFKICLLRVSHKREKCCWKKLATFSEFSRLPFQNKCTYEYSTFRRIFLMPKNNYSNMKGFAFSLIWKGIQPC